MGVTIPDTYDYGKSIPQPQLGTTGYKVGEAAVVSDAPAKALLSVGQDLKEVAADTEKWSLSLDTTMAQDALNKLRAKRSDLTVGEDGFVKVRGGDVLNKKGPDGRTIYELYPERLQSSYDELTANSNLSPRARRMLNNAAVNEITGFKADLARHSVSEAEKFQAATFIDTKSTLTDRAIQNVNEAKAFEQGLADVASAVRTRAAQLGVPSEAMEKAAVSDVVKFGIMQKIATGDSSAIGFYDKYKDRLDPKDSQAIEQSIKTMRTGVDARNWVATNSASVSGDYNARVKGYESGGKMIENGLGSGAFGPYQFMPDTWASVRSQNPSLGLPQDMRTATPAQHEAAHEAFKAGNAAKLQGAGLPTTDANLYLAHRFGAAGAISVLKADPSTPISKVLPPEWANQNPDMRGQTAGSFVQFATQRMGGSDRATWRGASAAPATTGDAALDAVNIATGVTAPAKAQGTGDQALDAVNAATGMGAPAKAASNSADGIVDARRMMVDIEQRKMDLTKKAQAELSGNLPALQATLAQINAQYEQQKAGVQLYKDNLYANVQDWMTKGGPNGGPATTVPPANIFSQLTWEQQQSIERQVERNIAGKKTVTNQQVWYNIQQKLTSPDPAEREMWANAPLFQFKEHLSDQDFQELAKLQAAARKGDPDKEVTHIQGASEMINTTARQIGIDTTPTPGGKDATKLADFHRAVRDQLAEFEKQKGHKATPAEIQKVIDQQVRQISGTGGLFSSDKRRFQMKIDDVPKQEKAKIIDALTRNGQPVTDEAVIELYSRKNAKAK